MKEMHQFLYAAREYIPLEFFLHALFLDTHLQQLD
jgi:hypothetical protein